MPSPLASQRYRLVTRVRRPARGRIIHSGPQFSSRPLFAITAYPIACYGEILFRFATQVIEPGSNHQKMLARIHCHASSKAPVQAPSASPASVATTATKNVNTSLRCMPAMVLATALRCMVESETTPLNPLARVLVGARAYFAASLFASLLANSRSAMLKRPSKYDLVVPPVPISGGNKSGGPKR